MGNRTVVSKIFWLCTIGNLSVVSIIFSKGKWNRCFNNFSALHWKQSLRSLNSFVNWKISPLFQQFFVLRLQAISPLFQFFSLIGNLTAVSTIFCSCIVSNLLVVSILLSDGKSKRCFNIFLALRCRHSIRHFNSFLKLKISPLFQQYFGLALDAIYPLFHNNNNNNNNNNKLYLMRVARNSPKH